LISQPLRTHFLRLRSLHPKETAHGDEFNSNNGTLKAFAHLFDFPYSKDTAEYKKSALFKRNEIMSQTKPSTFEEAIVQYTPMIHHLIKKLRIYKDFDDYIQLGFIALWEAYEKFDAEKGAFSAYAYSTMKGHLLMALKKQMKHAEHHTSLNEESLEVLETKQHNTLLEKEILYLYYKGLNKNEKIYIHEHIINDRPLKEIADKYNVKLDAVKWWGRSAKKKLKQAAVRLLE
jgi:RNA polymerase sigma factor (sigma-70 family)